MKVLIVEDSPEVVEAVKLCFELRWPGSLVVSTGLGNKAVELVETESPDIAIIDLGLPDMDGLDVLKEIRTFSDIPVLILTVRDDEVSKVKGLELGADDYIVKPFIHMELLARVRAILRRSHMPQLKGGERPLALGDLVIDFAGREITRGGEAIQLTPTEWRLLAELVRNEGKVLTYETLLRRVWGDNYINAAENVKKYVYRLRQKLGDNALDPQIIISVRGLGYKLVRPD
ncbi:MAG: response regulator transcription factor [Dehalococcoidales bacterium]|nr:response regulator transcription factor [Dehalococcoidales bacterium]